MIRTVVFYSILCFLAFIITYEALTQHKYDNFKVLIVLAVMGISYYKARKDERKGIKSRLSIEQENT